MDIFEQGNTLQSQQVMAQAEEPGVKKINLTQARRILGVSPNKMSKLIADGTIPYQLDPLDQRVKLVALGDVEKLKRSSGKS
jgi:predicted HTH domain antitoxin